MEVSADRGFLPSDDPLISLPITDYKQTELIYTWENLAQIIPHYLKEDCLREELVCALRKADRSYYHGFIDDMSSHRAFERVFLLLAYFATSYINSPEGHRKKKLPKEISIPFSRVAHLVSRKPVLDYSAYVLYNWRKINPSSPAIIGNVEPLVTFTDTKEEKLLITTLVEMEYLGSRITTRLLCDKLNRVNSALVKCHTIRKHLEDVFFHDFEDVFYEGWLPDKQSFSCGVIHQSPFATYLRKYLDTMFQNEYFIGSQEHSECLVACKVLLCHFV
jgi:hypothetical protein